MKRDAAMDERRYSTAAKIVIGREQIVEYGDSTVADVLKRLPGVTIGGRPGRGGEIRMRGMGSGYTLVLLNGERIPPGFSLDTLSPDQIERIEIYKAPTAEFGARAIAGTINIVLRDALPKNFSELQLSLGDEQGRMQPAATWTRNERLDGGGSYNLTISPFRSDQIDHTNTITTVSTLDGSTPVGASPGTSVEQQQQEAAVSRSVREGVHVTSRIRLPLQDKDVLTLQPFLLYSHGTSQTDTVLTQPIGTAPLPYATSATTGTSRTLIGRLNAQWQTQLTPEISLQVSGSLGDAQNDSHALRVEADDTGQTSRTLQTDSAIDDRSWNTKGKLSWKIPAGHSLVGGWEIEDSQRVQQATTLQDGAPQPGLGNVGDNLQIGTRLLALYGQDEWDPSPHWSAYAGLRWESIDTASTAAGYDAHNRSVVASPLLHAVWRPDEKSPSQIRMSLTQSYKTPTFAQLTGLPVLSVKTNNADAPDQVGTPNLRPERANGVDLAFEYYLSGSSILSASVFRRDIRDLIRTVTELESVSWSATPRWVARPQNFGNAVTWGTELEAKLKLSEIWTEALPVNLRANLSLYRSNVDGVPGPDNRIDQQPRAVGNLGGDYRFVALPLTVGTNLNWTPPTHIQSTLTQDSSSSMKGIADAYAVYVLSPGSQLRLSVSNFLPHDYNTGSRIAVPSLNQRQSTEVYGATHTVVNLRWELKL